MTFNPDWPEIRSVLCVGQNVSDIPVAVAHVFKSQLQKVLSVLCNNFGQTVYLICVVEFQKRGFPHAHIILKMEQIFLGGGNH